LKILPKGVNILPFQVYGSKLRRFAFMKAKTVQTDIPENLYKGAVALVKEGWFHHEKEVFSEAIRRFLESHQPELMDQYIREDVEWGLHGED
jgi:hypothetical protein